MDNKHMEELYALANEILSDANGKITSYLSNKYGEIKPGRENTREQLQDYLLLVGEVSAYLLGNAYALLTPESQDQALKAFTENVKRVIQYKEAGGPLNTPVQ